MLEAGIPLREALQAMSDQTSSDSLRFVLRAAIQDLLDGRQLSATLKRFPSLFDSFFVNVVTVGESSGTLHTALEYLATQMEKAQAIRSQVKSALFYPVIVFSGAIGIAVYLAFFLLPQILPLFDSLSVTLPWTTRLLIGTTQFIRRDWHLLLVTLAILGGGWTMIWRKSLRVRFIVHGIFLWIPVFGRLIQEIQMTQLARILGTLLQSGVKIVPALRVTSDSLTSLIYRDQLQTIVQAVERGRSISDELRQRTHFFSQTAISMVAVGEHTGSLPRSLLALADFSEREVEGMTKNMTTLIEPLVLILVGLLVGFVALSIIAPIYQLTQGIT